MTATNKARGVLPDFCFNSVTQIRPAWLTHMGIRGLLIDIDNTITRWEQRIVHPAELAWLRNAASHGLSLRLLSNGLPRKLAAVELQTGLKHVSGRPVKPLPAAFRRGLRELQLEPSHVMMIGDSVFTDVAVANRLGLWTCLIEPMSDIDFPGSKLHRLLEKLLKLRRPADPHRDYRVAPAP